mgnify:CR=1 FL=1
MFRNIRNILSALSEEIVDRIYFMSHERDVARRAERDDLRAEQNQKLQRKVNRLTSKVTEQRMGQRAIKATRSLANTLTAIQSDVFSLLSAPSSEPSVFTRMLRVEAVKAVSRVADGVTGLLEDELQAAIIRRKALGDNEDLLNAAIRVLGQRNPAEKQAIADAVSWATLHEEETDIIVMEMTAMSAAHAIHAATGRNVEIRSGTPGFAVLHVVRKGEPQNSAKNDTTGGEAA